MIASKRLGKFRVLNVNAASQVALQLVSKMIVIRVEEIDEGIEYTAICSQFDEIEQGDLIPYYDITSETKFKVSRIY